jgi:hypothetical protein
MVSRKASPGPADSVEELFEFRRFQIQEPKSFLRQPFSPKLRRRLELYQHARYWLWIQVETDALITTFNECTRPVSLAIGRGVTAQLRPGMVTRDVTGEVTVHTFNGALDDDEERSQAEALARTTTSTAPSEPRNPEPDSAARDEAARRAALISDSWAQWCEVRAVIHRDWKVGELREPAMRLQNLERLLRYTTRSGRPYRGDLAAQLESELRLERRMTVHALSARFSSQDPELVMTEIADLIVKGKIHSDIDARPFTYATELSGFGPIQVEAKG